MSKRFKSRTHNAKRPAYTNRDFRGLMGQWISFQTPWGHYRGMVERVRDDAVLIKMPSEHRNSELANYLQSEDQDIQLSGGYGPYVRPFPWCWFWFPFAIVIFIVPWFGW